MDLRSVLRYSHPMHMICNTQPQSILDDPDTGMIFDQQKDVTGVNNIAYIYILVCEGVVSWGPCTVGIQG